MSKQTTVIVHASREDMFMEMLNAKTEARVAGYKAISAMEQRDEAFKKLQDYRLQVEAESKQRVRRNKLIAKISVLALCTAGCALTAATCISNGLWWGAIAPVLTVGYSIFDLCHGLR